MRKKLTAGFCALAVMASAAGCGAGSSAGGGAQGKPELAAGSPTGEITVSAYDSVTYKEFLELAAKAFETKYPGTKINIQIPSQMSSARASESDGEKKIAVELSEDEQGKADYISRINTELMGGGGPDVLAMDIIPVHRYASNGQLEDLRPYMDGDSSFAMSDYRQNIFDALLFKGGQYVFPLDYGFNYYEYDSTLLDEKAQGGFSGYNGYTISQLAEAAAASFDPNRGKMFNLTNSMDAFTDPSVNMIKELMEENYTQYVDVVTKTARFDEGGFAKLLDSAEAYEKNGYIEQASKLPTAESLAADSDQRHVYKLKNNISLLLSYLIRDGVDILLPLPGAVPGAEKDDRIAGIQMGSGGSVKFDYTQGYGINCASQNKALAWEFIKFMASADMQASLQLYPMSFYGLPVHNEARAQKVQDGIRMSLFMPEETSLKSTELTQQQAEDYKEALEKTERFSDMINTYYFKDHTVNSIIHAELKYFFDGVKTSAETADSIQSKVEMYFNE